MPRDAAGCALALSPAHAQPVVSQGDFQMLGPDARKLDPDRHALGGLAEVYGGQPRARLARDHLRSLLQGDEQASDSPAQAFELRPVEYRRVNRPLHLRAAAPSRLRTRVFSSFMNSVTSSNSK